MHIKRPLFCVDCYFPQFRAADRRLLSRLYGILVGRVPVLYPPKPTMPCSAPSPEDSKSDSKHLTDNTLYLPYNLKCFSFTLSCLVIVTLLRLIFYFLYKSN